MKYALLSYWSNNLGDEIQSIAARQFLPRVDYYVERDRLNSYRFAERPKLILNGWYTHRPNVWPPEQDKFDPLIISFHISNQYGSSIKALTSPKAIEFYKRHEPVGCRDFFTRELLVSKGVDAYFSGCLTLTLPRNAQVQRGEEVLAVDVSEPTLAKLVPSLAERASILRITHRRPFYQYLPVRAVRKLIRYTRYYDFYCAGKLLERYARAKFVITSRLHCALPCLAMGTPVVMISRTHKDPRFEPLLNNLYTYTIDAVEKGDVQLNIHEPRANPGDVSPLIKSIKARIDQFLK